MIQFLPVILICNSLFPKTECKEGKRDVTIVTGEMSNTPMSCLIDGNQRVAKLAFAPTLNSNYYVKIKCVPIDTRVIGQ
jgi:hypothetical protein